MGIIQRQTIKGSIYSYIGALIGFVNVGVLLPKIFLTEQVGLTNLLLAISIILIQFAGLGVNSVTTRLFPYFRNEKNNNNGYLFISLMVTLIGFCLALLAFFIFTPYIIEQNVNKSPLFVKYIYYIIPLTFFTLIFNVLDNYNKVLYDAVFGTFLRDFVCRILNFVIILLFAFNIIDFDKYVFFYVLVYSSPVFFITALLLKRKQFNLKPNLSFLTPKLKKMMISVAFFGLLTGFSAMAIVNIDRYMINSMIDLSATGIYSTTFFFGTLILIPARSLRKVSSAIIADAWKDNDIETISQVYFKSTINQLIIGSLLFIGIWANINNVFQILPAEYQSGKYVILFIGILNLLDMSSGVSGSIISTSNKYKVLAYLLVGFLVLVVVSNFIFIPIFGIAGAALASLISNFLFILSKYIFLVKKYKMQPYNYKHLVIVIIAVVSYLLSLFIPEINNFYFDIIVRSSFITIIFFILIYFTKVSVEINQVAENALKIIFKIK
ncbi:MAG: polysaccharide biosynthesis C-terminal domain-containing protein [Bacteroidetes bacterium]|nr:polysaccharide biosynthesis C-terminal domain-containing protein [Bacteroidota bacterium]